MTMSSSKFDKQSFSIMVDGREIDLDAIFDGHSKTYSIMGVGSIWAEKIPPDILMKALATSNMKDKSAKVAAISLKYGS